MRKRCKKLGVWLSVYWLLNTSDYGQALMGNLRQWKQKENWLTILIGVAAVTSAFYGAATITVYLFAMSDSVASLSAYIPWGFVSIRYWSQNLIMDRHSAIQRNTRSLLIGVA